MSRANVFRPVPRTGVIYVMSEASRRGFRYGHPEWSNLGQGAPETGPLPGSLPRVHQITLTDADHEYAPVGGLVALREAVAEMYNARYRVGRSSRYTWRNVAISSGGRTGLTRVAASLGAVNLGHLLPDYTAYEELLEVFRAFTSIPILLHPEDGFALSVRRLEETVVGMGLGAVLLSNPANPTGHVVRGEALDAWVGIARRTGCAMIFDEFYAHYLYDVPPGEGASAARFVDDVNADPIVIVDGLTKNWRYPGWRLSWTLGPEDVVDRLISAGSFLDGGPAHPLQQAAIPLITADAARQEAAAIQAAFSTKRALMVERLAQIGLDVPAVPQGAFYCFASLEGLPRTLRDGMSFFRSALDSQVICVPGAFFDVDPGQRREHIPSRLEHFVRLSFGPDLPQIERGLDRIEQLVRRAR